MSFTKTISTIAALASIFGAAAAGWKLAENSSDTQPKAVEEKITQPEVLEEKITELEEKLKEVQKQPVVQQTPTPQPQVLPPLPPVPEPKPGEFE